MVKKIIIFAVGLIITVSFMYLVLGQYDLIHSGYDAWFENQLNKTEQMNKYPIVRYDGQSIDGAKVVSYIKEICDKTTVVVTTNKKTFIADESKFKEFTISTSDYYIAPTKLYKVEVTENKNGIVTQVTIVVQ